MSNNADGDPPSPEGSPLADALPLIQIKLPEVDETIVSTHSSEVAFYEATFQAGVLPRAILGSWGSKSPKIVEHPKSCYNKLPVLTKIEQQRFDQFLDSLEQGQTYLIKVILSSRSFLKSFALDSRKMASSGGDNAGDKLAGGATQVASDKVESHHSRDDPPQEEGTSANPEAVLGLKVSMMENLAAIEKLLEGVIPLADRGRWKNWISTERSQSFLMSSVRYFGDGFDSILTLTSKTWGSMPSWLRKMKRIKRS
ncbi:hypothetical protein Acr_18g0008850 [Actinidia rufa]|uniref:Uncharacterized protein n=1 Tax=Actinidia rufa TaxID=165716 RepID=A0A7J0G7E0_9ERIC|nr:hypothetical protein Acr_18g0008850 [Actinidia rufa]